ncbi:MAG: PilN domain-containing protein [Nitrospirae bacterium]|nr:PilN domain-containing protein [Nitrospirota bacterium]
MKETLNLLSAGKIPRPSKGIVFYIGITVVAYVIGVAGLSASNIIKAKNLESEIRKTEERKSALLRQIKPPPPPLVITDDKEIAGAINKTPPWDIVLSELSVVIPDEVWLNFIDVRDSEAGFYMRVNGLSKSQVAVASFMSRLEASIYFSDAEIVFSQKGQKDVAFELKVKVQWT